MSTLSWQVLHGHGGADGRGANWEGLLPDKKTNGDTLHPELRAEILKYGELAQATYDGFYGDPKDTAHFGKNRFKLEELLNTSLPKYSKAHGYKPVKYLWATSGVHNITADALIPSWRQMAREAFRANKVHLNMAGFIAHSPPTQDGTIDVVIAWRGTLVPDEWASNLLGGGMKDWEGPAYKTDKVQVHTGFFDIYTNSLVKYQQPPKQDIHLALDRLLLTYKVRSITTTGHSLGGALAILSAAEIAHFLAQRPTGAEDKILVPDPEDLTRLHEKTVIRPLVSCFAYAPPQPGNKEFLDLLQEMKVPVLRVTNEKGGDIVPRVPNVVGAWQRGKPLQAVAAAAGDAAQAVHHGGGYQAAGVPLQLDSNLSTIVNKKDRTNWLHPVQHLMEIFGRSHNLELYLWLLATQYGGQKEPEGPDSPLDPGDRDWALLNKSDALLRDEFNTPGGWWADLRHKGLVKDRDGRWRKA